MVTEKKIKTPTEGKDTFICIRKKNTEMQQRSAQLVNVAAEREWNFVL